MQGKRGGERARHRNCLLTCMCWPASGMRCSAPGAALYEWLWGSVSGVSLASPSSSSSYCSKLSGVPAEGDREGGAATNEVCRPISAHKQIGSVI